MNKDEDLVEQLYLQLEQEFIKGKSLSVEEKFDIKRQRRLYRLTNAMCNAIEAKMKQYYPFW